MVINDGFSLHLAVTRKRVILKPYDCLEHCQKVLKEMIFYSSNIITVFSKKCC